MAITIYTRSSENIPDHARLMFLKKTTKYVITLEFLDYGRMFVMKNGAFSISTDFLREDIKEWLADEKIHYKISGVFRDRMIYLEIFMTLSNFLKFRLAWL